MKHEKNICTICKINRCDSDLWCPSCYVDFATANGVFGSEAIKEYQKQNKKVDLIPKLKMKGGEYH